MMPDAIGNGVKLAGTRQEPNRPAVGGVVHVLSWREVDFAGVLLAGLVAGYLMAIAGMWAGRVRGLVAVDFADIGRRYMVSDRPSAWLFGLASHMTNSVILVLFWAMVLVPNLPW